MDEPLGAAAEGEEGAAPPPAGPLFVERLIAELEVCLVFCSFLTRHAPYISVSGFTQKAK